MEAAVGQRLPAVRVHTDGSAGALSRRLHALAFSAGRDVFFRRGAYRPTSAEGRKLLGHEAAHVAQQVRGASGLRPGQVSDPGDQAERQAEAGAITRSCGCGV